MGKSGRVRIHEIRAAYRLIHDCRDVGDDPGAWPQVLVRGAAPLVNAQVGILGYGQMDSGQSAKAQMAALGEHGWLSQRDGEFWHEEYVKGLKYHQSPTWLRMMA